MLQRGDGLMWQLTLKQLPVMFREGGFVSFAPVYVAKPLSKRYAGSISMWTLSLWLERGNVIR